MWATVRGNTYTRGAWSAFPAAANQLIPGLCGELGQAGAGARRGNIEPCVSLIQDALLLIFVSLILLFEVVDWNKDRPALRSSNEKVSSHERHQHLQLLLIRRQSRPHYRGYVSRGAQQQLVQWKH
jgi:hypothetical protein